MVVCDMISHTKAKDLGLNTILITSGVESIESAFDQAVKISRSYMKVYHESLFLKSVLKNAGNSTVIFDEKGEVYLSLWDRENEAGIIEILKKELPRVWAADSHKFFGMWLGRCFPSWAG